MKPSTKHRVGAVLGAIAISTGVIAAFAGAAGASQPISSVGGRGSGGAISNVGNAAVKAGTYKYYENGVQEGYLYLYATHDFGLSDFCTVGVWSVKNSVIGLGDEAIATGCPNGAVFAAKVSAGHLGTAKAPGKITVAGLGGKVPWYATFTSKSVPNRATLSPAQRPVVQATQGVAPPGKFPGTYTTYVVTGAQDFDTAFYSTALFSQSPYCDGGSYLSFDSTVVMTDVGCELADPTVFPVFLWMAKEGKTTLGTKASPGLIAEPFYGNFNTWYATKS